MASTGMQIFGFVLALLGIMGAMVATVLPNWKVSADVGSNIITAISQMQGLWMDCTWWKYERDGEKTDRKGPIHQQSGLSHMLLSFFHPDKNILPLPGGEQMAKPSSPPAGCYLHATGISVGTTAGPGSPLGSGFYPTLS